jgi:quinol monooxygenase YgiN
MQSKRTTETLSLGLFVRIEAKPGMEDAVAAFLMQGLQLADQEPETPLWFALRLGRTTFAVFDAFRDESGRQTHLNGPIAKALMEIAETHFAAPPSIEKADVLGAKIYGQIGNTE